MIFFRVFKPNRINRTEKRLFGKKTFDSAVQSFVPNHVDSVDLSIREKSYAVCNFYACERITTTKTLESSNDLRPL